MRRAAGLFGLLRTGLGRAWSGSFAGLQRWRPAVQRGEPSPRPPRRYHEAIREPFDYYAMGCDFIRGLVDRPKSVTSGFERVEQIKAQLAAGDNVVLLANHQVPPLLLPLPRGPPQAAHAGGGRCRAPFGALPRPPRPPVPRAPRPAQRAPPPISPHISPYLPPRRQTEADPQIFSLLLDEAHPGFASETIFVAGDRVTSPPRGTGPNAAPAAPRRACPERPPTAGAPPRAADSIAMPFSMGRNLLCIFSKRQWADGGLERAALARPDPAVAGSNEPMERALTRAEPHTPTSGRAPSLQPGANEQRRAPTRTPTRNRRRRQGRIPRGVAHGPRLTARAARALRCLSLTARLGPVRRRSLDNPPEKRAEKQKHNRMVTKREGRARPLSLTTAPHRPAWRIQGRMPLLRAPERRLGIFEACGGLGRSPPAAPTSEEGPPSTTR